MVLDFPIASVFKPENGDEFEINSKPNMAFGLGYKFRERYSLELRYHSPREILNGYASWLSDYNTMSVIFGYSHFLKTFLFPSPSDPHPPAGGSDPTETNSLSILWSSAM